MEYVLILVGFFLLGMFLAQIGCPLWVTIIIAILVSLALSDDSEAAAGRSYSPPSRSYSAPRQAPRTVTRNVTVNKTVVNRTTVVQQNRGHSGSSGPSATSSFFSGAAGALGGSLLGQWLFAPKTPEPAPQVAPEAPVAPVQAPCDATLYDCTPKAQVAQ